MKILLAVDGSETGLKAAHHVVALSKSLKAEPTITLLHADPPLAKAVALELGEEDVAAYHADNGAVALKKARAVLKRAGLAFAERPLVGEPAATILKQAKSSRVDLIVMGTHGRGALKSLIVGSVTQKVISTSDIPVTVVR
ncbi:universal stress protein [Pseudoxanthomonas sp. UTMC 1351]|uniref:universal stress protein n=1 Tax=Pseudoxanthomonas sp. UTMC 1351 TaxID=2695853 RepID=UPI0034CF17A6